MYSFQAVAFDETYCGNIAGFEFSNGSSSVTISNDQSYYIGDLPNNFYVDLIVNGYSQSAKFYVKNLSTGQNYSITENHLPYTFPGGNGAWNFGYGEFEVKAKLYKYNSCYGSYCDSETIKFEILSTPNCGDIDGFQFSNGTNSVAIVNDGEYSLDQLPANFYVDLLVDGYSESASFKLKNKDTGAEYTIGENHLPYTAPGGNAAWSYGTGEFEIEAKIFKYNYCQGSYCDKETIKFTITDVLAPDCACEGGMTEVTFTYSGGGSITTNTGSITNNGDGTYTVSDNGLKLDKNLEIVTNGCNTAQIHTSCSQDVLGVTFTGGVQVIGYVDTDGNSASLTDGCIAAPDCGTVTGFVFTDGVTSIPIVDGDSYDINTLPANFYVEVVLSGFPESVRFSVKNEDTGNEFISIDNDQAFTYPNDGTSWSLGISEFKVKAEIFKLDNAMGDKCDYDYLKFTLFDGSIPDCPCQGGLVELTFNYSGSGTVTTNSGTVVNNGDGTYTAIATGDKLVKDFEVYINGATAQIHTSCSQDLLGITFGGLVQVIGYVDTSGNTASINDGCGLISDCGTITGFEFSNFTSDPTVAIVDGGSYDFNNIPANFNINVLTSGNIESAFNTLTNVDTGEVYTKLENVLPYTFPGATYQVWTLGCGTFNFCSSVYKLDGANGAECDSACVTFTITNCDVDDCGVIDQFAFSDGTVNTTIVDGESYNISDLPADFYVDAIVAGESESVRLTVTNLDTNASTVITENVIPYTYPAGGAAWSLGLGNFEVQAEVFSGNYCSATLCDTQTINFTLVDALECESVYAGTASIVSSVIIITEGVQTFATILPTGDAIVPSGYVTGTLLSNASNSVITTISDLTTISLPELGGYYNIHTIAYDPSTLDLTDINLGVTTINDLAIMITNNEICADIDTAGVSIMVIITGSTDKVIINETKDETVNAEQADQAEEVVETDNRIDEVNLIDDIKLYPNPVVNSLNVDITLFEGEILNYMMIDLNGKQVLSGSLNSNTNVIQTKDLAAGLYILKLNSEGRSFTKKIVVKK